MSLDDYLFTYFISACNTPGDMLGVIDCGLDWGCAVHDLRPQWELGIQYSEESAVQAFFDSGAVSEYDTRVSPPKLKYRITDRDWHERLGIYLWVAQRLGSLAYLVAPDNIISQDDTLVRLRRYSDIMQECYGLGANVIIAHQPGDLSLEDFTYAASDAIGIDDFVVGFPMRELPGTTQTITPLDDLVHYCEVMQPERIHLLGIGPRKRHHPTFEEVLEAIVAVAPDTDIHADSNMLRGMRGTTGPKRKPRELKVAIEESIALLRERIHGGIPHYEDVIEDPRRYVGHVRWRLLVEGWFNKGLISRADVRRGLDDPPGLLHRERLFANPIVRDELDTEWRLVTDDKASQIWKRREGIRRVLCPEAYEPLTVEAEAVQTLVGPRPPKRRA